MTPCNNCHAEGPTRLYRYALGSRTTALDDGCYASLTAIGMSLTLIERRETDLPVMTERRRLPRPRWMGRLTARADESWRVAS